MNFLLLEIFFGETVTFKKKKTQLKIWNVIFSKLWKQTNKNNNKKNKQVKEIQGNYARYTEGYNTIY